MALLGAVRSSELVLALLLLVSHLFVLAQPAPMLFDSWLPATANQHTERVLEQALQQARDPTMRLCFRQISAIQQQVVNGLNFRYQFKGCAADSVMPGRCSATSCETAELFQADVFCQPWTNTAKVLNVAKLQ